MVKPYLEKGATIDGFVLEELLHKGGMARLWRVSRPDITIPILMKVPILAEGEDPAAIVSFEMEQMILPRLTGEHVPKVLAVGNFAVQPYIVMELIEGESLLKRLTGLPLPYEEVADIGVKIATALDALHRQHVIHLDIKPSNVIIRTSGKAALIDFGLSHHEQLPDLMHEEFLLPYGTAPYMAPEQLLTVRNDPRSDLFSLGVLLYFFSTGVRPFGTTESLRGMRRRLWQDPVPPRRLKPDYPPWLQEIVLRCLEVEPAWRHPTAAQLAFDLSHHSQIKLTARSERLRQDSWATVLRRRFNTDYSAPAARRPFKSRLATAPIVAIAVDITAGAEDINDALRVAAERTLKTLPSARLACVNVLKQSRIAIDTTLDEQGHNKHVDRLVALKCWAEPLKLAEDRVTFHVLEATDPASTILGYAEKNRVDHILIGARQSSLLRTLLGSVSAKVAAEATCTVTIVRPARDGKADKTPAEDAPPPDMPLNV
jgi:nucleotide-binding universal stress UspA family protein